MGIFFSQPTDTEIEALITARIQYNNESEPGLRRCLEMYINDLAADFDPRQVRAAFAVADAEQDPV